MTQITLNNRKVLRKLQKNSKFRKDFLKNTERTLAQSGVSIDRAVLDRIIKHQLGPRGQPSVASTVAIITVF